MLDAARAGGARHFVLLSAICVQRPLLEFQRAKLKLEAELVAQAAQPGGLTYSIVRPTAFFKSLGGQVQWPCLKWGCCPACAWLLALRGRSSLSARRLVCS